MKKKWIFALALSATLFGSASFVSVYATTEINLPDDLKQQVEKTSQLIQSNSEDAEDALTSLLKKCKDKELVMGIGNYFLDKGQMKAAIACAERVYKLDNKFVPGLLFEGKVYEAAGDKGLAGQKYEEAIYTDVDCIDAYVAKAHLYKSINATIAKETLLELKAKGVTSPEINRELASVYYQLNDVPNAISAYKEYFANNPNIGLDAKKEYAILQYLSKDFAGSLQTINEVIGKEPKDLSLNRMKFYNLVEEDKLDEAKAAAANLFGQYADTLYNFNDYAQRAYLNVKLKNYTAAIPDFEKALSLNSEKLDFYKDISDAYERSKDYDKAIAAFNAFMDKKGDNSSLNDRRDLGKVYYNAAIDAQLKGLSEKFKTYVALGDTAFAEVCEKSDSYVGPFYRAKINLLLDLQNPLEAPKNYFAEALKRMEGKGAAYDSYRKDCYAYLMFYAFKHDNLALTKEYYQKVIAIDPNNENAKTIAPALK
ncbi:MAG: tetratricopeptide repeat protein [Bacteroidaceae bacterium]